MAQASFSETEYRQVARLFSPRPSAFHVSSPIGLHECIRLGFPRRWVVYFLEKQQLPLEESLRALNISSRTYHRFKTQGDAPMDADQSARLWNYGEVLSKAEEVLGSREAALDWLSKRAIGLEGHRPLDLLQTLQGAEIVKTLLDRMAYGVYS
jgi:putative toxin-antitoxin system antitoxin component (TIGR02293 family)